MHSKKRKRDEKCPNQIEELYYNWGIESCILKLRRKQENLLTLLVKLIDATDDLT